MGSKENRTWRTDQEAVSEVVGSALLVGLTVAAISVFGLVATQAFSPVQRVNADLSPSLDPGGCPLLPPNTPPCWGGGDEEVRLHHLGGAPLERGSTKIVLTYTPPASSGQPQSVTTLRGAALGAVFDNGFVIGEIWTHTASFATCGQVQVQIIIEHSAGGSQLLLQETLVANEGVCP